LYYLLKATSGTWEVFEGEGTVFGAATKQDVAEFVVSVPPSTMRCAFNRIVGPMDDHVALNEAESRTLAAIRDALLPKLMSGEVRVRDVEPAVGGAA
jgi:type I restriction enzyme S subunit